MFYSVYYTESMIYAITSLDQATQSQDQSQSQEILRFLPDLRIFRLGKENLKISLIGRLSTTCLLPCFVYMYMPFKIYLIRSVHHCGRMYVTLNNCHNTMKV